MRMGPEGYSTGTLRWLKKATLLSSYQLDKCIRVCQAIIRNQSLIHSLGILGPHVCRQSYDYQRAGGRCRQRARQISFTNGRQGYDAHEDCSFAGGAWRNGSQIGTLTIDAAGDAHLSVG